MTEAPKTQYDMPKAYEPGKVEVKWYQFWMEKGYFTPKLDHNKKPFVIIMLPPITPSSYTERLILCSPYGTRTNQTLT